ncbi:MAG: DUF934 domain-containing protein [Alphaproteobacteria bacterium]|jgi:uncharacterized protein (DUF934 family)|nr:DUF934 domain-containing protein [Alphaproteobacteria bacterium]MDP6590763.1 DUF934 domain-containing protein [Alphaproteobacteria bacterium]MDP6817078.1 DUF934 domain-containing protein [Alphaproteobacteria bacterium]
MPLIKNGAIAEDAWQFPADDAPLPGAGPVAVSLARWRREREVLLARGEPIGLAMNSDERAEDIASEHGAFELIALDFPTFRDGRPYSTARLLRERYGYGGELRAVGDVSRDQFLFMHRCGFDAFQVSGGATLEGWLRAVSEISIWYQPTGDPRAALGALRHVQAAAAE